MAKDFFAVKKGWYVYEKSRIGNQYSRAVNLSA